MKSPDYYLSVTELHMLWKQLPVYSGTTNLSTPIPIYSGTTQLINTTTCLFRNYTSYQHQYLCIPKLHILSTPLTAYSGTTHFINATTCLFRNYTPYQHHYLSIPELHTLPTPLPVYSGTTHLINTNTCLSRNYTIYNTTTCLFRNYTFYHHHYLPIPELYILSTALPVSSGTTYLIHTCSLSLFLSFSFYCDTATSIFFPNFPFIPTLS
jgi:hypothetical protein